MSNPRVRRLRTAAAVMALLAGVGVTGSPTARACDNDSDSRPMERNHFPEVSAILSGEFVRHSPAWFEWRVRDRRAKLGDVLSPEFAPVHEPSAGLSTSALASLDDLGVAYDKLGRTEEAIATGRLALAWNSRRYESLANLGTFLAHAGRRAEGVALLREAVEVNPDAHFGRAQLQIDAIEYVETRRHEGTVELPLFVAGGSGARGVGFPAFLAARRTQAGGSVVPLSYEERDAAVKGVVGLLFSTRHDDPVLLELLAHTLVDPNQTWRADETMRLSAARAYLKAADASPRPEVASAYRGRAAAVLERDVDRSIGPAYPTSAEVAATFEEERRAGAAFFAAIRANEEGWIARARDPEAAFVARYDRDPASPLGRVEPSRVAVASANAFPASALVRDVPPVTSHAIPVRFALVGVAGLVLGAGLIGLVTRERRRSRVRGCRRGSGRG